jgi:hypothetical protein
LCALDRNTVKRLQDFFTTSWQQKNCNVVTLGL